MLLKFRHTASNQGFSIIEAFVVLSVMAIAGIGLVRTTVTGMKANKSIEYRGELDDVKRTITSLLNCQETFASYGSARPIVCASGTTITLKNNAGANLAPGNKIAEWSINAKCESLGSPSKNGLSVYATIPLPGGGFKKDPLRNINFDSSHPISSLFHPDVRLCPEYFVSASPTAPTSPQGTLCGSVFWSEDDWGGRNWPCGGIQSLSTCLGQDLAQGMAATCASGNYATPVCPTGYSPVQMAYSWGFDGATNFRYKSYSCKKN